MSNKSLQQSAAACSVFRIYFQPGVNKGSDQPRPDRPLVIGGIARAQIAEILGFVIGMAWRQRTQSHGREQSLANHLHDRRPAPWIQNRMRQRNGEDLIRTTS